MKVVGMLLAVVFLLGSQGFAETILFTATLLGSNENPANDSLGTGFAQVLLDQTAHTMQVQANFSGLTGTTTQAHIHCCVAPPGNVGVASQTPSFAGFPLGVLSGSYQNTYDLTQAASYNVTFINTNGTGTVAGAEAALVAGLLAGQAYFNIHTTFRPGGEIRGFLGVTEIKKRSGQTISE